MEAPRLVAVLTYAPMGLTFIALSIPLLLGKVPPNHWYGFRTRLTLSDPQIWYPVNAWGARRLLWLGAATLVAGLLSLALPESWLATYLLVTCALWVLALVAILVLGVRYARRLAENSKRELHSLRSQSRSTHPRVRAIAFFQPAYPSARWASLHAGLNRRSASQLARRSSSPDQSPTANPAA